MNLYIRYFDDEVVVSNVEDALEFVRTHIKEFSYTADFEADFREYVESTIPFPKRYKVRPRVYFIVIKTLSNTLEEFKTNGKSGSANFDEADGQRGLRPKDQMQLRLNDECPGWYEGSVTFKRVVINSQTGKFDYCDTTFAALVKAYSAMDCYNRIIDHLRSREDVDPRSQFPSAKGKNFRYTYIGLKPLAELNV